ncbi:uncharacterized protein LOC128883196 [Hylaeus volcanicus]|uniref:uncharacterized protein LOC128883196 n=1 Tax=Hylaeus volcanicus TaxID=313075 RepID=UPI0023B80288|nr:uncharacterized protein LOC128883196 [Hylaeus volcanicus]
MSAAYTIRVRKFLSNPLLERKQFVLEVLHPERANVSKSELKEKLSKLFKVADDKCIILFGFQTAFGGGRSSGFGLIYDSLASCQKFEKRYRLVRCGVASKRENVVGRRAKKDIKNRQKKVRGTEKAKLAVSGKK